MGPRGYGTLRPIHLIRVRVLQPATRPNGSILGVFCGGGGARFFAGKSPPQLSLKTIAQFGMPALVAVCLIVALGEPAFGQERSSTVRPQGRQWASSSLAQGKRLFEKGRYSKSIRLFSAAIRRGENAAAAYRLRGRAYEQLGTPGKAIKDFTRYIKLKPSDPKGYILRANANNFNHGHARALEDYNRAIKLAPSSVQALLGRGLALTGLQRYREAIRDLQSVLKIDPRSSDAITNMGRALMLAGKHVAAM